MSGFSSKEGSERSMDVTETSEQWKQKGNDLYTGKQYKAAIDAYSKAIELDSGNALLYNNRAAAHLMVLQFKEAVADTNHAISLDPSLVRAYLRKATALKGLGQLDEAIAAVQSALAQDPNNKATQSDLQTLQSGKAKIAEARALLERGQTAAALVRVDAVLKDVSSSIREVNLLKVECLVKLRRLEEALNLTNTMMKTAQNGDVELLMIRATCLFNMGDVDSALKHMQQAVRSDPDNVSARTLYRTYRDVDEKKKSGDEAFRLGKNDEAIAQWSQCIDLAQQSPVFLSKLHLNRGIALAKGKKHEEAIKDYTKAIYYNNEYVKAYLKRSESFIAQGGPDKINKAIEDLEKAGEIEQDEDSVKDIKMRLKKAKVALKRSKRKDLYAILGVGHDASESEIKTAYRKAALKYHPDRHSSKTEEEKAEAETMFKSIGEAYEVLSNPEKKSKYDGGIDVEDLDNPHAGAGGFGFGGDDDDDGGGHFHGGRRGHGGMGGMGGIDPNVLFQMFMQQQHGGGGGGGFGGF